jgi:hypothetical protein
VAEITKTKSGALREAIAAGLGRRRREDAIQAPHGDPRGNAHLTAWTGLLLFVLFADELVRAWSGLKPNSRKLSGVLAPQDQ